MENKHLLEKLSRLGFPLLENTEEFDVNQTLAEVVRTRNGRYWEGFPVLVANAAKEGVFDYGVVASYLKGHDLKDRLKSLLLLSLAVYELNGLQFGGVRKFGVTLNQKDKDVCKELEACLEGQAEFDLAGYRFNPDRIKKVFLNYFIAESNETKMVLDRRDELSLEFSLSQVFSPKQKELFRKKLKGDILTKTEKEYFSRSVKKKVLALANSELHRLAQKAAGL